MGYIQFLIIYVYWSLTKVNTTRKLPLDYIIRQIPSFKDIMLKARENINSISNKQQQNAKSLHNVV
jgi:hypothetical protein